MLSALYIENLAVIEKSYIEFPKGFSVFTGETGAGKSIMIDAINACLGQRTSREIVRSGTNRAEVSAVFQNIPDSVRKVLNENGYASDGSELIIERSIYADGGSNARINSKPAAIGFLREIGGNLINIHGQHDNQILLSPDRHLEILDNYGDLQKELAAYQERFAELRNILRRIRKLSLREAGQEKKSEMLRFQIEEIQAANLKPGIEEQLIEKSRMYRNVERIAHALQTASTALFGDDDETQGALDLLSTAQEAIGSLSDFKDFAAAGETLEGISIELSDLASGLHDRLNSLDYDQQAADLIEARLSEIHRLKLKYGSTVSQILDFMEDAKRELASIENADEEIRKESRRAVVMKKEVQQLANELTSHRKDAAKRFVEKVAEEARFLEMPNLRMEACFSPVKLCISGDMSLEFRISANLGEPPKSISKIASGGELARIMLAIKSAMAEKDQIGTLIFDEIDTGVSGRAAQKIGLKLREVANSRQVLCVTHSAQVAALGHAQFLIKKITENGRTFTQVVPLDQNGRVDEIARIMGTDQVSELARETARKMLENS